MSAYKHKRQLLARLMSIVWFQKISILPPQIRDWKFQGGGWGGGGGGGVWKSQKFKAMYEAKLEFPEGWGGGGHRANPFRGGGGGGGGVDIFWDHTL